jgi:Glyoxalase/Bleomycin resistance protein/Dioxygenase superfamily
MTAPAPADRARANVILVLEVPDADTACKALEARGFLPRRARAPWGGSRFFCIDPDGYLVETEQPAS